MTTAVALAMAVAAVAFVLHPLLAGVEEAPETSPGDPEATEHRRRMTLLTLEDLEYDFHAGKLSESDYLAVSARIREELRATPAEESGS